ncbi:flagellar filament capping protein FliD [Sphingomonas sp. G-3-2-10]|uniref:flagellar filament capping protein FliD n=1 Tax=Sphingomonas sp. G-3-2-10 TaxID=2728838 RepID=UPI00146E88C0|nr:flagellar filament capping protein FliD [Sphingomonas sp. G-3-2-10]NML08103.1 flagellar filament capping protein FliD [Sphingomonas sp. G-3-2-10]
MAIESITKTLGSGSGIDISALVTSLVEAQTATKAAQLTAKNETLTAQISATSSLKSAINSFDTALKSLIRGGAVSTQPTSSNTSLLNVSVLSGASAAGLSAQVEVRQLASGQVANSATVADKSAAIGQGTLTLTFGNTTVVDGEMTAFAAGPGTPVDITIDATNSSLQGVADAINAKKAGVTASILTDSTGSRLVLKSATGASQGFTLSAAETAGHEGLSALAVGVGATGTTIGSAAQDAIVAIDGVPVRRAVNSIPDIIPGIRLDLVAASVGTKINIGSKAPTDALQQAVGDIVDTYNELYAQLKTATDPVTGPLRQDSAAKAMLRSLSDLSTRALVSGGVAGSPKSLSEIGVSTNRDGTLTLNSGRLTNALLSYPDSVEAMFKMGAGLSAQLSSIAVSASSTIYGLGASETRYTKAKTALTEQQTKATEAAEVLRTRMTRQFASMDSAVAAYKSTQTFIENQVKAWNSDS